MAIDALIIAVCLLAIPDLVIFGPDTPFGAFTNPVIQFHHNFFLGPVNEVLHGGAVLVDTASQYGVGSLYFLAGWFELAPIGYGTFGFLDGGPVRALLRRRLLRAADRGHFPAARRVARLRSG